MSTKLNVVTVYHAATRYPKVTLWATSVKLWILHNWQNWKVKISRFNQYPRIKQKFMHQNIFHAYNIMILIGNRAFDFSNGPQYYILLDSHQFNSLVWCLAHIKLMHTYIHTDIHTFQMKILMLPNNLDA